MYSDIVLTENYLASTTLSKILSYVRYKKGLTRKFTYAFRLITGNFIAKYTVIGNKSRMRKISEILQELQYDAMNSTDERFANRCFELIQEILLDLKKNCNEFNLNCNEVVYSSESFIEQTKQQQKELKERVKPNLLNKLKEKLSVPALIGLTAVSLVGFKYLFDYLNIRKVNLLKAPFVSLNILTSSKFNVYIKVIVGILLVLLLIGIFFLFRKTYDSIMERINR